MKGTGLTTRCMAKGCMSLRCYGTTSFGRYTTHTSKTPGSDEANIHRSLPRAASPLHPVNTCRAFVSLAHMAAVSCPRVVVCAVVWGGGAWWHRVGRYEGPFVNNKFQGEGIAYYGSWSTPAYFCPLGFRHVSSTYPLPSPLSPLPSPNPFFAHDLPQPLSTCIHTVM
jgi:hypothetical protein